MNRGVDLCTDLMLTWNTERTLESYHPLLIETAQGDHVSFSPDEVDGLVKFILDCQRTDKASRTDEEAQ